MIFDPVEERLCIRIVYDGAGGAGKTTNLRALAELLPSQQATELHSPGELDGRTLYFDWLRVNGGVVCGYPLLCQIISVPGQTVMTPRRRHLLATADVVVLVCDSDPVGVERAREGLARVGELVAGLPLVVQANMQGHASALDGARVLAALGTPDAVVVEAIATDGVGVLDTFVAAVRLVARTMQARSDAGALDVAVGRVTGAQALLARLEGETLDPAWAAEMFLEEAQAAFLIDGGFDRAVVRPRRHVPPSLPRSDVETGFVWPAHGRPVLDTLDEDPAVVVDADGMVDLRVANRRLRTSRSLRFDNREAAREALVRVARERTQLDQMLPIETVLVLQPARDGAWWLWTVMPDAPSLAASLAARTDTTMLAGYGRAIAAALRVCLAHGFTIDLRPSSFALVDGRFAYTGVFDGATREIGAEVVRAMDDVARQGATSDAFLEAFEEELGRLTPEEATRVAGSTGAFRTASSARQRLEHALAGIVAGGIVRLATDVVA